MSKGPWLKKLAGGAGDVKPKARSHKAKPKVTRAMVDGLVQFINMLLSAIPATQQDALEPMETEAFSKALYESALANQYLANFIIRLTSATQQTQLVTVSGAILARRLARREMIPMAAGAAAELYLMAAANIKLDLSALTKEADIDPPEKYPDLEEVMPNVEVEARATRLTRRQNGKRQDDPGRAVATEASSDDYAGDKA